MRRFDDLRDRIRALQQRDADGRPCLPNGVVHDLRSGLFLGRNAAKMRLRLAQGRLGDAFDPLLTNKELFWPDGRDEYATHFLDAMELVDFWLEEETLP